MKKILIELGEVEPSNIIVNYRKFKVMARINSKLVPVANVTADLGVEWLDHNIVNEEVSDAMNTCRSDLGQGEVTRMDAGHGKLTFGHGATPTPEPANDVSHCLRPKEGCLRTCRRKVQVKVIAKNSLSCMLITKMCKVYGTHPVLTIPLQRLIHVISIYYAFVKRGVVMILNRGRRHWVINCSFPEGQPIGVLELVLGESLLWKWLMSIFHVFSDRICGLHETIFNVKSNFLVYFPTSWDHDELVEQVYDFY